jgi:hypothetical protein
MGRQLGEHACVPIDERDERNVVRDEKLLHRGGRRARIGDANPATAPLVGADVWRCISGHDDDVAAVGIERDRLLVCDHARARQQLNECG